MAAISRHAGALCLTVLVASALLVQGCGEKAKKGGGGGPRAGVVEAAFHKAAAATGTPVRFLMATAWLESRLAPENATATYVPGAAAPAGDDVVARGTVMTETAFGLTQATLGLDSQQAESATLEAQIDAYARWVQTSLAAQGVTLKANPATDEDKYYWIANLAALHRKGLTQRRNVQIIFAEELMDVLNEGFVWQDPRNGDKLTLQPERPAIDVAKFPQNGQSWFHLAKDEGQIYRATYLPLVTVPTDEFENRPKRVEVIHCPLSLSACLELQTRNEESDVHLAAHYVIPPIQPGDGSILSEILQVANHREALILTNRRGDDVPVEDAVVVMLAGNSGRTVAGERRPAIPTWFTDMQLRAMAQVVNDVCTLLAQRDPDVNREQCMRARGDRGVRFRVQESSEESRWGDIADFDPTIFEAYLASPTGLGIEAKFEFAGDRREYRSGEPINFNAVFNATAREMKVDRLRRCKDGRTVWEQFSSHSLRNAIRQPIQDVRYDSGPNGNGDHFYRARLYGGDGALLGWTIDRVVLAGFEPEPAYAAEDVCR